MLTGGVGDSEGVIGTAYATPTQWLLEDIKSYGFDMELL